MAPVVARQKLPEPPENPEVLIEVLMDEYDEEGLLECDDDDEIAL